jgi:hypothetical protein
VKYLMLVCVDESIELSPEESARMDQLASA